MSKQIALAVLGSIGISLGGFFASCGSGMPQTRTVVVAVPQGCTLVSPEERLELGTPVVQVKPGANRFVFDCGKGRVTVTREIRPNQAAISFTESDLGLSPDGSP